MSTERMDGAGGENIPDPLTQLMNIGVSDGADIYALALTMRNFILRGESFKIDSRGNVLAKYHSGFTAQVIPTFTAKKPGDEIRAMLQTVVEHDLIVSVLVQKIPSPDGSGNFMVNTHMGFLKHFELESDVKAFCREHGVLGYVNHALNDQTGLAATVMIAFNPTDRVIEVLESHINKHTTRWKTRVIAT